MVGWVEVHPPRLEHQMAEEGKRVQFPVGVRGVEIHTFGRPCRFPNDLLERI